MWAQRMREVCGRLVLGVLCMTARIIHADVMDGLALQHITAAAPLFADVAVERKDDEA